MSTYVRTNGGQTVHLTKCRWAVNYVPWLWAEGKSVPEIKMTLTVKGIKVHWCRRCFPGGVANIR